MKSAVHGQPRARVTVCEAWPRDGIQGWPQVFSTAQKSEVIQGAMAAGIQEIDVTSMVPARVSAQFADSLALLASFEHRPREVVFRALVVNLRSIQTLESSPHALAAVDVCGFPLSASEPHNLANLRRTHAEQKVIIASMTERILNLGKKPLMAVATAFGCPLQGVVPLSTVMGLVQWAAEHGIKSIMLGDTTGMADPAHVFDLVSEVRAAFPDIELIGHFHDTRGSGIANTLAAIDAGVRRVDASLGGVGGEPPVVKQDHAGEAGNVCTEDLVALLDRMRIPTGIDPHKLVVLGKRVEELSGRTLRSQVLRAGLAAPRDDSSTRGPVAHAH
ncbi:MAG: hypothetical protein JWR85_1828 [Marmoricola sp.]|nr:hypothetical protein [Marmoricola sp.]